MQRYTTLISAAELSDILDTTRVLDCRAQLGNHDHGRQAFLAGHIPGAVHVDLDRDLADPPGAGGRHPLPDRARWLATCQKVGLKDQDQIVVVDDASGAFAARAWWMLRWLGHADVAVLDGGLNHWQGALTTDNASFEPSQFSDRPPLTRLVSAQALQVSNNLYLVDARAQARFSGEQEPIDHKAGHIPGAVCLPFSGNLDDTGRFLPKDTLAQRFSDCTHDTVCYCGSGVTAAHNILAMVHAGLDEPALYPGSWSEWIEDPARPIATT